MRAIIFRFIGFGALIGFFLGMGLILNFLLGFHDQFDMLITICKTAETKRLGSLLTIRVLELREQLYQLYFLIGGEIVMALISIVFIILSSVYDNKQQSIVYVEKQSKEDLAREVQSERQQAQTKQEKQQLDRLADITNAVGQQVQPMAVFEKTLGALAGEIEAVQGILYAARLIGGKRTVRMIAGYAYYTPESHPHEYEFGEGLAGQAALTQESIQVPQVPQGYLVVASGLGNTNPRSLLLVPLVWENQTVGIFELAAFQQFDEEDIAVAQATAAWLAPQMGQTVINFEEASLHIHNTHV